LTKDYHIEYNDKFGLNIFFDHSK